MAGQFPFKIPQNSATWPLGGKKAHPLTPCCIAGFVILGKDCWSKSVQKPEEGKGTNAVLIY